MAKEARRGGRRHTVHQRAAEAASGRGGCVVDQQGEYRILTPRLGMSCLAACTYASARTAKAAGPHISSLSGIAHRTACVSPEPIDGGRIRSTRSPGDAM